MRVTIRAEFEWDLDIARVQEHFGADRGPRGTMNDLNDWAVDVLKDEIVARGWNMPWRQGEA